MTVDHQPNCSQENMTTGVEDCANGERRIFMQCHECGQRAELVAPCDDAAAG